MQIIAPTLCLMTAITLAADPEPKDKDAPRARELEIKGVKSAGKASGKLKPTRITSAKELEEAIPDKDTRDAISKKVDLKKEYVLLFAWAGSGGDRLSFEVKKGDKGEEAVFTMKRGLTRDLRRHVKLYAIPAKMGHKMAE